MTSRRTADFLVVLIGGMILTTSIVLAWAPAVIGVDLLPDRAVCWSRVLFDRFCPGCGLTRSFVAVARGSLTDALRWNPLGPVLFAAIVLLVVLHGVRLAGARLSRLGWIDAALATALAGVLVAHTLAFYFRP